MAQEVENLTQETAVTEEKKLTAEELTEVQSYDSTFQKVQFGLGEIAILKKNWEKRETELWAQFDEAAEGQNKMRETLQKKYGNVSIDKSTGLITEGPAPEEG